MFRELSEKVLETVNNAGGRITYPDLHASVDGREIAGLPQALQILEVEGKAYQQVVKEPDQIRPVHYVIAGSREG